MTAEPAPRGVRWVGVISEATGYLSGIALLAAAASTVWAVAARYFFGAPTVWQGEVTIYLMMFVTFVGAAYGLKHHAHVGVDLLIERLSLRPQAILKLITSLMCLAVVLVVCWTAGQHWIEAIEGGFRSPTAWRAPLSVVYAILPVGMFAVALQYVAFIVELILGLAGRVPLAQANAMGAVGELAALEDELRRSELGGSELGGDDRGGSDRGTPTEEAP